MTTRKYYQSIPLSSFNRLKNLAQKAEKASESLENSISLDELKEVFTDPKIVKALNSENSTLHNNAGKHIAAIINNFACNLPPEDILPFAEFLTKNEIITNNINSPHNPFVGAIGLGLYRMMEQIPPQEKFELAHILANNNFGRTILGESSPGIVHSFITKLAEGIEIDELDQVLAQTSLLADVVFDEELDELFEGNHYGELDVFFECDSDEELMALIDEEDYNPDLKNLAIKHCTDKQAYTCENEPVI